MKTLEFKWVSTWYMYIGVSSRGKVGISVAKVRRTKYVEKERDETYFNSRTSFSFALLISSIFLISSSVSF